MRQIFSTYGRFVEKAKINTRFLLSLAAFFGVLLITPSTVYGDVYGGGNYGNCNYTSNCTTSSSGPSGTSSSSSGSTGNGSSSGGGASSGSTTPTPSTSNNNGGSSSTTPTAGSTSQPTKKSSLTWILVGIVLVLFGLAIFLWLFLLKRRRRNNQPWNDSGA